MLKKFTAEGRFESNMDSVVAGKVFAFVPVLGKGGLIGLGIAVANEAGYNPIPLTWCHGDSWNEMQTHADELNKAEGLGEHDAARIICSTMRAIA